MKARTVAVLVVALAAGYPATSWFLGHQVSSGLEKQYAKLADNPFVQVRERKLESGVFESVETVTLELMPAFFKAINEAKAAKAADQVELAAATEAESADEEATSGEAAPTPAPAAAPMEPLRFTLRTVIKHGPFPGFAGFGAAQAHTELVLDAPRNPVVTTLYGDKSPLTADTTFGFLGGGHQVVLSPAVDATLENQAKVSWGEVKMEVDFTRDVASYAATGGMPFLKFEPADASGTMSMTALAFDTKQKLLFEDDPYSYIGPMALTVDNMDFAGSNGVAFAAEKLRVASDVVSQGEFLDISASYGAQTLKFGPETVGPSQIDIGFRHINAKAVSDMNKEYVKLIQSGEMFVMGTSPDMSKFKPMAQPLKTIIEGSPEIAIDKLEIGLPQGKVTGQVAFRLPNAKIGDLEEAAKNPLVLMGLATAVEVEGKFAVPEVVVVSAVGEDKAAMVPAMVGEGYLVQENGTLSTNFKYATGQLAINGKNVNLGQLGGGGMAGR